MIDTIVLDAVLALITTLPVAWRWGLRLPRVALTVVALTLFSGLLVTVARDWTAIAYPPRVVLVWLLTLTMVFAVMAYCLYRDPERTSPDRHGVIVSPADGKVLYVRESRGGNLPAAAKHGRHYRLEELTKTPLHSDEALVIGIGMSVLDIHVNRAPISGRITLRRHFPGPFHSLRRLEAVFKNERATTVIEREGLQVAVVQIASRLVRQVTVFVREGDEVTVGQRIGAIRLGSQVDVVLPAKERLKVMVKPGERVRAGESIVARLISSELNFPQ